MRNGIEPPTGKESSRRILEEVRAELAREAVEGQGEIAAAAAKRKKIIQDARTAAEAPYTAGATAVGITPSG